MRDFRSLKVWEKSHRLVLDIYRATESFPSTETYGITSQMRRAAYSIPMNIAEGCGRRSEAELARFMDVSMGSASELEYALLMVYDLGFIESETYHQLNNKVIEVKKMLAPFIKRLRS